MSDKDPCRFCGRQIDQWRCMNTRDMEELGDEACKVELSKIGGERVLLSRDKRDMFL